MNEPSFIVIDFYRTLNGINKQTNKNKLYTNEGGKLAHRFIDATRIATRGWHLSRLPRDEEEDTD